MAEESKKKWKEPKPSGYEKEDIIQTFKHYRAFRQSKERMWKLIRDLHNGDFWRKVAKNTKKAQVKPDTNYLHYVESNITNSVYAANYHANILPRHYADNEEAMALNSFIDYKVDKVGMKSIYPLLGKEATLYNFSAIQIGWDSSVISGTNNTKEQGSVEVEHIPYNEIYLDGSVSNYKNGRAIFINRQVTLYDLINERGLKEGALAYKNKIKEDNSGEFISQSTESPSDLGQEKDQVNEYSRKVELLECFFKVETEKGYRLDHIFIADMDYILYYKEDIKPKEFPIEILYGQKPDSDPYGTPMAWKLVGNIVALNLLDSIEGTHAYASQNRTKLFSNRSGINYRSFSKYGNTPNMAFVVKGDPDKVVRYVDVQQLPQMDNLKQRLEEGIQLVSGVDPRYIGRETGSIQTTGGTDMAQERIMSTTDATRIVALEDFTENLTKLMIDYYIEYGGQYSMVQRDKLGKAKEYNEDKKEGRIDFKNISENRFDYSMNAAPYLPRNTMRLAEAADHLIEMQGQYQFNPPLITHQEWLQWQNFPQKELILQRIRGQSMELDKEEITSSLLSFAGMIDKGLSPEDAVEIIVQEKQQQRDEPGLGRPKDPGNTGQGGLV